MRMPLQDGETGVSVLYFIWFYLKGFLYLGCNLLEIVMSCASLHALAEIRKRYCLILLPIFH